MSEPGTPEPKPWATILIVEDNLISGHFARRMIQCLGHEAHLATNGKEALEFCADQEFDLVLMDCEMPLMDGLETTRALRSSTRWHSVPIVALSGRTSPDQVAECLAAGMNDFVTKPLRRATLRGILGRWLRAA